MAGRRVLADGLRAVTKVIGALAAPREQPTPHPAPTQDTARTYDDVGSAPAQDREAPVDAVTAPPEVEADAVAAAAVEQARAAATEVGGATVGDHLGVQADGPLIVTHSFAATSPGYVGWHWAVTVSRAEGGGHVTVDEVVMLPGGGALVAPAWVPWSERVRPDDLSPGDLLPTQPDDGRLVPAYVDDEIEDLLFGLGVGLGRERVLSLEGRQDTAERWYDGLAGPQAPLARSAPAPCSSCGFFVPLSGSLHGAFGACANSYAPDDGRVVALDHGCGAHSEVVAEPAHAVTAAMVVEDDEFELVPTGAVDPAAVPAAVEDALLEG